MCNAFFARWREDWAKRFYTKDEADSCTRVCGARKCTSTFFSIRAVRFFCNYPSDLSHLSPHLSLPLISIRARVKCRTRIIAFARRRSRPDSRGCTGDGGSAAECYPFTFVRAVDGKQKRPREKEKKKRERERERKHFSLVARRKEEADERRANEIR